LKVLKIDHPDIKEDKAGIIYYKRRTKVSKVKYESYFSLKYTSFKKILYVVDCLSKTKIPKLLMRIERPALAYLIRKEIFNDQISQRASREYANLLILLAVKFKDLI
jgi:hypothetical protein